MLTLIPYLVNFVNIIEYYNQFFIQVHIANINKYTAIINISTGIYSKIGINI